MAKIALLQMTSGVDPQANFDVIADAMEQAQAGGAEVLFTPEMSLLLDRNRTRAAETLQSSDYSGFLPRLAKLATRGQTDLAIGSMPIALGDGKWVNRAHYFPADGRDPVTYDKIHMFDVELSTGETWRESATYEPGRAVQTLAGTPLGMLGFTICYDLRFPALFEALGTARCDAISVPAAFTVPTGQAHWHVMLRARAIEASAFVIAAAQFGTHEDGRETYGHSLVVDPWGEVLLDMGGDGAGIAFCDIDLDRIADVRQQLPSLANKRKIPN
ncbi:carbon-nitrogen hydrolase family protein [Erythrobacter sp. MTPC3]|uniref:carbon-nitrogen hydrolase family protein n=1 Tax=Erythrobacter sp. MTPC3 TaxID=3056564 RepID=UPI0036F19D71